MLAIPERTKVRVLDSHNHKIKVGQKDTRDSVKMRLRARVTNTIIDQFSPELRRILFERSTAPRKQKDLDGVEPVSDLNSLSKVGQRIGDFPWSGEQSGCVLVVDRGLGDSSNIELTGTVSHLHFHLLDGGPVEVDFFFVATPTDSVDDVTSGRLVKTKKTDIWVTLNLPEVDQQEEQREIDDQAGATGAAGEASGTPPAVVKSRRGGGTALTPINALKKSQKDAEAANAAGKARA